MNHGSTPLCRQRRIRGPMLRGYLGLPAKVKVLSTWTLSRIPRHFQISQRPFMMLFAPFETEGYSPHLAVARSTTLRL